MLIIWRRACLDPAWSQAQSHIFSKVIFLVLFVVLVACSPNIFYVFQYDLKISVASPFLLFKSRFYPFVHVSCCILFPYFPCLNFRTAFDFSLTFLTCLMMFPQILYHSVLLRRYLVVLTVIFGTLHGTERRITSVSIFRWLTRVSLRSCGLVRRSLRVPVMTYERGPSPVDL